MFGMFGKDREGKFVNCSDGLPTDAEPKLCIRKTGNQCYIVLALIRTGSWRINTPDGYAAVSGIVAWYDGDPGTDLGWVNE